MLRRFPSGLIQPEIWTQGRTHGIDSLLATRPWADIVDMQIFLDGFEAGAQWYRRTHDLGSEEGKRAES